MRRILIKVWQGLLTPKQALRELRRTTVGLDLNKEKRVLEVLSALGEKELTVNEVEQMLGEEGVEYENLCQML